MSFQNLSWWCVCLCASGRKGCGLRGGGADAGNVTFKTRVGLPLVVGDGSLLQHDRETAETGSSFLCVHLFCVDEHSKWD